MVGSDAINLSLPIVWNSKVRHSKIFGQTPPGLLNAVTRQPIAYYRSKHVLSLASFTNDTRLKKKIRVLSTNVDRNGTNFVSTFEGKLIITTLVLKEI